MTNRYPLIIDPADGNKIKELPAGDNLNLLNNSILGVQDITALGTIDAAIIRVAGQRILAQTFTDLSDTPNNYTGAASSFVKVNSAGTALEFADLADLGDITVGNVTVESGNIVPAADNTRQIGTAAKKFTQIHAVDVYSNLRGRDGSLVFDASNSRIPYAAIFGAPTALSEFTNDMGFVDSAGIGDAIDSYLSDSTNTVANKLVNGLNEVVLGTDGALTFPSNTLKTVNGTDAVAPSTNSTAGAPLIITAGTGGTAADSQNAGDGGDLTISAGNAGSDIGNPSWGAIGGTLVLRAGNSTQPYAGGNVEIRSGTSSSIPGTISLHTGTNQLTFDATGRLVSIDGINLTAGGQVNICTIVDAGSGYTGDDPLPATTTGGSGTGMTVAFGYGLSGQLANVSVVDPGLGYNNGDVISVGGGTGTFELTRYNDQANQGNSNFVESSWLFGTDGTLTLPGILSYPNSALQRDTGSVSCLGNASTMVYTTSSASNQHTMKLLIQVEGFVGAAAQFDTQACEMIIAKSFRADAIAASVYGVVHTSVAPLATFTANWNALTSKVEVFCTTPSANSVDVKIFATEITTSD